MKNEYLDNKVVLKYCKDYYRIINEEFSELDYMSDKVIEVYQSFIFSINIKSKTDLKKIKDLNDAVARYFDDREFKTILTNFLVSLKISKKETDVIGAIANSIINEFKKNTEGYTRYLYIPKWIQK